MGSLWGHLDEGVAFYFIAFWWMVNVLDGYIKCGGSVKHYKPKLSYDCTVRGRRIPLEIYWKLFTAVGGFLIELFEASPVFVDEEGRFQNVTGLQHMSIFALFFLHALLDFLRYYNWLFIEGLDYLTFAMSFFWYGCIFYFHTKNEETDQLENTVHLMAIVWCLTLSLAIMWEYRSADKFLPHYCRSLLLLCLGTWFIHTPFLLFSTDSFPGENPNPRWDRTDPLNSFVMATLFGAHLFFNTSFSIIVYLLLKCRSKGTFITINSMLEAESTTIKMRGGRRTEEKYSLLDGDDDEEENEM